MKNFTFLLLVALLLLGLNCAQYTSDTTKDTTTPKASAMQVPKTNAPEINTKYGWVNTAKAYRLQEFRGKIVLLDFWTFGCINCQHIIPDLEELEKEFENELVVIGIHSAKFSAEQSTKRIQEAILKFGIRHPVVNDADMNVWRSYAIRAWPTLVMISPDGKVVWQKAGERFYDEARKQIKLLKQQYANAINTQKFPFQLKKLENKTLLFPSKIIQATTNEDEEPAVWVADSGNNRILKINLKGKVLEIIGKGQKGFENGAFDEATFYEPHGLALKGDKLYIADTKNNVIREADLLHKTVRTVVGNGEMGYYFFDKNWNEPVNPNSPWDLLIDTTNPDLMYIANAGNHQILKMNLKTMRAERFAGSGREQLTDGNDLRQVAFNQPSGLAQHQNILFIADAEASAIRQLDVQRKELRTLVGTGLFNFGDRDGALQQALLQHPVGVFYHEGKLYLADTYNGKIKIIDIKQETIKTFISGLNEPNDLLIVEDKLLVTDTNNHQILKIDLKTFEKEAIVLKK